MPDTASEKLASDSSSQEWFKIIISFLIVVILVFTMLLGRLFYDTAGEIESTVNPGEVTEQELTTKVGTTAAEMIPIWQQTVKSKKADQRMLGLRGLQYYGISQASHLLPLLEDPEQKVRTAAIQTMGNMRYLPALPAIVKNARTEKKMGNQILCIQAMGKICQNRSQLPATRGATDYLMEVVKGKNTSLRRFAHNALQQISGTRLKSAYSERRKVQHWEEWYSKLKAKK